MAKDHGTPPSGDSDDAGQPTEEEWAGAAAPYEGDSIEAQMYRHDGEEPVWSTDQELEGWEAFEQMEDKWKSLGIALALARESLGLSKREAARRAGLSDGAWRHLESGSKVVYGKTVLPNPRPENLVSAARAVGLAPQKAFQIVGRAVPTVALEPASEDELAAEIRKLSADDREVVERLVFRLSPDF